MLYNLQTDTRQAILRARKNRFVAEVEVEGTITEAHLPNSGRLLNVLVPYQKCWVSYTPSDHRKTSYDLLAVESPCGPIIVDARLPNKVFHKALIERSIPQFSTYSNVLPEYRYGESRFDFCLQSPSEPHCLVEVKSAADFAGSIARFPDAPSRRAQRHVTELAGAVARGWRGAIVFIAQMSWAEGVLLNHQIDPCFAELAKEAALQGVRLLGFTLQFEPPDKCRLGHSIEVW